MQMICQVFDRGIDEFRRNNASASQEGECPPHRLWPECDEDGEYQRECDNVHAHAHFGSERGAEAAASETESSYKRLVLRA